jgi:hypothetical protein
MTTSRPADKLLKLALTALAADAQGGRLIEEEHIVDTVQMLRVATPGIDEESLHEVISELARRLNVWSGKAATLIGKDPNHHEWLPGRREDIEWRFWNRYRLHLEAKLPPRVVNEIDESTDLLLSLLEDPKRVGGWRRQGMVVGHVQSGKTGNYTGLIAKAADAGYKVIVVLSGIHNSLRSQTQIRLDEGFLGYAREFGDLRPDRVPIGVGLVDGQPIADSVTTRDQRGDFSKIKAQGFQIHAGGNVVLFVVKKNVSVLTNLVEWAKLSAKKPLGEGRSVVADVPLLVIDDEADQASIDIKHQPIDEETGQLDKEHEPARINGLIRRFLEIFERRAYVGYTATPFANVFIHPDAQTTVHGPDLFPKHFIINLSAPSDYFGPARVFGSGDDIPLQGESPSRVRFVTDADLWVPPQHKGTVVPRYEGKDCVPPSLETAVRSFILACAARRARGQETEHKSMLVHVSRFTAVQHRVHGQITELVDALRDRWRARETSGNDPLRDELRALWEADFVETSVRHGAEALDWDRIEPEIRRIFDLLKVNLINAKASDALVYEEHKQSGLHVIAVGGDKLSRGLTLEGLTCSYFLRSARMYDTLMQMGRWFGYRPGYEDLCRLYLTEELAEWYGHITDASEELRQEFDRMVLVGGTPDDYGLRIRSHPVLAITGRLRPGTPELMTSLSATPFEPTVLSESPGGAMRNWEVVQDFIAALGEPADGPVATTDLPHVLQRRGNWPGGVLWRDVAGGRVLDLLKQFEFADKYLVRTPSTAVRDYITDRLLHGELVMWTVVVLGKKREGLNLQPGEAESPRDVSVEIAGRKIWSLYRQRISDRAGVYVVKRVGSPKDESVDLAPEEWAEVDAELQRIENDPQRPDKAGRGRLVREKRPPGRGLLILYLLTPGAEVEKEARSIPMVAPFISFPASPNARPIRYAVNTRFWEEELGGVE